MKPAEKTEVYTQDTTGANDYTSRTFSFTQEIYNTVYTVNTHFDIDSTETVEGKVSRILTQDISL